MYLNCLISKKNTAYITWLLKKLFKEEWLHTRRRATKNNKNYAKESALLRQRTASDKLEMLTLIDTFDNYRKCHSWSHERYRSFGYNDLCLSLFWHELEVSRTQIALSIQSHSVFIRTSARGNSTLLIKQHKSI